MPKLLSYFALVSLAITSIAAQKVTIISVMTPCNSIITEFTVKSGREIPIGLPWEFKNIGKLPKIFAMGHNLVSLFVYQDKIHG